MGEKAPDPGWTTRGVISRVIDGDTVEVEITRKIVVRLRDCWAPEKRIDPSIQGEIDRNEQLLNELAQKLSELTRASGGDLSKGIVLTPELEREVQKFTEEQAAVRKALRDIRRAAREEVDSLGRGLAWINLLAAPALAGLAGLLYAILRRRRAA